MSQHGNVFIESFVEPNFGENAYVVDVGRSGPCWIVDPGLPPSAAEVLEHVEARELRPEAIVLTHGHADHIAGIPEVLEAYPDLPIYIAAADRPMLSRASANLSALGGVPFAVFRADDDPNLVRLVRPLEPPGPLALGPSSWQVADVSGHAPGGRSLYCAAAGVVIVGDALFEGSIGRTDFPGSDHRRFIANIRANLLSLPDETVVLSGHGPSTTIGRERRYNPFLT